MLHSLSHWKSVKKLSQNKEQSIHFHSVSKANMNTPHLFLVHYSLAICDAIYSVLLIIWLNIPQIKILTSANVALCTFWTCTSEILFKYWHLNNIIMTYITLTFDRTPCLGLKTARPVLLGVRCFCKLCGIDWSSVWLQTGWPGFNSW
jgi:hypothetical protein